MLEQQNTCRSVLQALTSAQLLCHAKLGSMRLTGITIERFKLLERVDFDIDGVNAFIGGNNSGKSTIIQAVHFAFTILQSLNISNKWPVKAKKSSTISPLELIYIPSEDPYSLGYGGRLLVDSERIWPT